MIRHAHVLINRYLHEINLYIIFAPRLSKTMKYLLLLMLACSAFSAYSQKEEWTKAQTEILEKFGLNKDDHRGVILQSQDNSETSIKTALESFFISESLSDMKTYEVIPSLNHEAYLNRPLSTFEITKLYSRLK